MTKKSLDTSFKDELQRILGGSSTAAPPRKPLYLGGMKEASPRHLHITPREKEKENVTDITALLDGSLR